MLISRNFVNNILINISLYILGYLAPHIHVSIMHLRVVIRDCICILVILWCSGSWWSGWRGPSYDKCSPSKGSVHRCSELCVKHGGLPTFCILPRNCVHWNTTFFKYTVSNIVISKGYQNFLQFAMNHIKMFHMDLF